ncbi:MAG TPA: hypothetical protein VN901_10035 [Candidatus Acidoferrales bacterium]|nr:hypothetical protein [Candidatus Acidoferrales bacterium]
MMMRNFVQPKNAAPGNAAVGMQFPRATAGWLLLAIPLAILALLTACNSNAPKAPEAKPEPKGPDLLTARAAFQKLFIAARNYAADVRPFRIESTPTTDGDGHDGKSAIWQTSFASPTHHGVKPFIWSGSAAPDAPSRGVSPGNEDVYNPGNASTQVFDVAFLKVDSDQAFAVAQKHGGEKILGKDPATPVIYVCDWNHNTNELVWHVIYGSSRDNAKLTVAVNASTGEFIRVEK